MCDRGEYCICNYIDNNRKQSNTKSLASIGLIGNEALYQT